MRHPAGGLRLPILLCLLSAPAGAAGQTSVEPPDAISARASLGLRTTTIRGERTTMVGATGLLGVGPAFAFGGSGWVLTEVLEIDGSDVGGGLGLRFAYGGLEVSVTPWRGPRASVRLSALLGAGNAKIELPAVGAEIAADNFFVVEPEIALDLRVVGPAAATIGLGYRAVAGVEDLAGVGERQLRGSFATIGLVIGH